MGSVPCLLSMHHFESHPLRAFDAGWVHYRRRQAAGLRSCAERVAAHWSKTTITPEEDADRLRLAGVLHELEGRYEESVEAFENGLALQRLASTRSVAYVKALNDLAESELLSGRLDAAERHSKEALRASLALKRLDFPTAEKLALKALDLCETIFGVNFVPWFDLRSIFASLFPSAAWERVPIRLAVQKKRAGAHSAPARPNQGK